MNKTSIRISNVRHHLLFLRREGGGRKVKHKDMHSRVSGKPLQVQMSNINVLLGIIPAPANTHSLCDVCCFLNDHGIRKWVLSSPGSQKLNHLWHITQLASGNTGSHPRSP